MSEVDRETWDEIMRELVEGTPDTPERRSIIQRADAIYARIAERGETKVVLMAQRAWESTDTREKFDHVCPPIVYEIARRAYRMGRMWPFSADEEKVLRVGSGADPT